MVYICRQIISGIQEKTLISQLATSSDLEKINGEIIDIARFRFVSKFILGGSYNKFKGSLMDINQLQSQEDSKSSLYESGEQLLEDLLKNKKVIHYRQLRYLAEKHESDILKLRFVLNPLSFVFLLSGQEQFHLVMETLDTREATYIWHIEKDKQELRNQLQVIDRLLNMIRNDGRQAFLESKPVNFSRVLHDYSDGQKGFILKKIVRQVIETGLQRDFESSILDIDQIIRQWKSKKLSNQGAYHEIFGTVKKKRQVHCQDV